MIVGSLVQANGQAGVVARAVVSDSSEITGNTADVRCGLSLACADVLAERRPELTDTVCGTSGQPSYPAAAWDVCLND